MFFKRKKNKTESAVEVYKDCDTEAVAEKTETVEIADALSANLEPEPKSNGFLWRLTSGLSKSSSKLTEQITGIFTKSKLDADTLDELEDTLIMSDMGASAAAKIRAHVAKDRFDKDVDLAEINAALADAIADILRPVEQPLDLAKGTTPQILLFVGVNGAGKTTTIGKIAYKLKQEGAKTLLVAGDTFRAAAVEQLMVWGERTGVPVMTAPPEGDAAALAFEAIERAVKEGFDCVLIDTAGRLQNRTELMGELAKILRVIRKKLPEAPHHTLLVLDATVGQNALSQVKAFQETADVSGLVMTKLDGTAKGGVMVALAEAYNIPVHFVGVGESVDDLDTFNAQDFANALVGKP